MDPSKSRPSDLCTPEVYQYVVELVQRYHRKFALVKELPEDIAHDVLVKILEPSERVGTSYLERFEPGKNSMKGYLSGLIFNHFRRLHHRAKHPISRALSISDNGDQYDEQSNHKDISRFLATEPPSAHDSSTALRIFHQLDETHPYNSGVIYTLDSTKLTPAEAVTIVRVVYKRDMGITDPAHKYASTDVGHIQLVEGQFLLWRSVANIYLLLLNGLIQEAIADIMGVSRGWVSKQVLEVRKHAAVEDWAEDHGIFPADPVS